MPELCQNYVRMPELCQNYARIMLELYQNSNRILYGGYIIVVLLKCYGCIIIYHVTTCIHL